MGARLGARLGVWHRRHKVDKHVRNRALLCVCRAVQVEALARKVGHASISKGLLVTQMFGLHKAESVHKQKG